MRALLGVDNSRIDAILPASYATAHRYIVECYISSKTKVTKALAKARSSISVSFDGWLADNQLDILGITTHYLDEHLRTKTVLLGLRPIYGAHSGVAIAEQLLAVMRDFKISDRVGYIAHILNLVAKAIVYSTDGDCVADAARVAPRFDSSGFGNALIETDELAQPRNKDLASLAMWRRRGALGRCHNLVYHVKGSPRRRRYFESKQREISDSRIY